MTSGERNLRRSLALWLEAEAQGLAEELAEELLCTEPDWRLRSAVSVHAVEDVRVTLAGLVDELSVGRGSPNAPDAPVRGVPRLAAWAAEEGMPWDTVARAWSRCQHQLLDRVLGWLSGETWPEATEMAAAMRAATMLVTIFGENVSTAMASAYHATAPRVARGGGHQQSEQVDDLLAGRSVEEDALRFELRSDHLGAVVWGGHRSVAIRDLAQALNCDVTIEARRNTDWAWFHGKPDLRRDHEAVLRSFVPPPDSFLSIGRVGSGKDGFAVTHRQARHAERVAVITGASLTLFSDIALEAFALSDEALARRFANRWLSCLSEDHPRSTPLRSTLQAYFDAGNKATAAATLLNVHERTVTYRIRAAEGRLNRYLTDCQDELAFALRLQRMFESIERPNSRTASRMVSDRSTPV